MGLQIQENQLPLGEISSSGDVSSVEADSHIGESCTDNTKNIGDLDIKQAQQQNQLMELVLQSQQ